MADEEVKWHQKSWLMWICLILIPPIGLLLLFLSRERHSKWKFIAAFGLLWCFLVYAGGNGTSKNDESPSPAKVTQNSQTVSKDDNKQEVKKETRQEKPKETKQEKQVEYVEVDIHTLMNDLEGNAAAAQKKYKGKNLKIVNGIVGTIDSDGDYFSIEEDQYSITGVHCSLGSQKLKDDLLNIRKGSTVIVYGKISDVGEILGYSLDTANFELAR